MISKLVIGTAQFSSNYGISNTSGKVKPDMAEKILRLANKSNIKSIDTAIGYKNCHKILGKIGVKNFEIITKIPELYNKYEDTSCIIDKLINKSRIDLKVNSLNTVLIHKPDQLKNKIGEEIIKKLDHLKNNGMFKKIGISIYNPEEIDNLKNVYDFEVVQCPINVFDRRMCETGKLEELKSNGTEIHARSIFLQGLLLMKSESIPGKFNKWINLINEWNKYNNFNQTQMIKTAVNHVFSQKNIDKVIIGFQSDKQLEQILGLINVDEIELPNDLKTNDELLLNPIEWDRL